MCSMGCAPSSQTGATRTIYALDLLVLFPVSSTSHHHLPHAAHLNPRVASTPQRSPLYTSTRILPLAINQFPSEADSIDPEPCSPPLTHRSNRIPRNIMSQNTKSRGGPVNIETEYTLFVGPSRRDPQNKDRFHSYTTCTYNKADILAQMDAKGVREATRLGFWPQLEERAKLLTDVVHKAERDSLYTIDSGPAPYHKIASAVATAWNNSAITSQILKNWQPMTLSAASTVPTKSGTGSLRTCAGKRIGTMSDVRGDESAAEPQDSADLLIEDAWFGGSRNSTSSVPSGSRLPVPIRYIVPVTVRPEFTVNMGDTASFDDIRGFATTCAFDEEALTREMRARGLPEKVIDAAKKRLRACAWRIQREIDHSEVNKPSDGASCLEHRVKHCRDWCSFVSPDTIIYVNQDGLDIQADEIGSDQDDSQVKVGKPVRQGSTDISAASDRLVEEPSYSFELEYDYSRPLGVVCQNGTHENQEEPRAKPLSDMSTDKDTRTVSEAEQQCTANASRPEEVTTATMPPSSCLMNELVTKPRSAACRWRQK